MDKEIWFFWVFLSFVRAATEYDFYNNDGWIPITNMQGFNSRRAGVITEKQTIAENTEQHNLNDFIQIVTPNTRDSKDYSPFYVNPAQYRKRNRALFQDIKEANFAIENDCKDGGKGHYRYYFKIANNLSKPSHLYIVKLSGSRICTDREDHNSKILNFPLSDTTRFDRSLKLPKEIADVNNVTPTDELNKHATILENIKVLNSDVTDRFQKKSYEVTEEAESTDTDHGYVYEMPKFNNSNKLNLTNKLFNILAKYNIRADDDLQNYILSRTHKDENPNVPQLDKPFDLKSRGYNSLNHLPVDPLLAVFLSHYGHYLPSAYGIRSNYNNAYGYLASNNIRNKKPFGMYKMFSDNDSRN